MKMPELFVFVKAFTAGIVGAELFRVAFYAGEGFASVLFGIDWYLQVVCVFVCLLICLVYAWKRGAHIASLRLGKSLRVDLFAAMLIGVWSNSLVAPLLNDVHKLFYEAGSRYALAVLVMLLLVLLSPLVRLYWSRAVRDSAQLYFLSDEEIKNKDQDVFASDSQAKTFADRVLASGAHSGLVFGVDGPWGVGKTSFINLAESHWANAVDNSVIVFRFEPLRYANEPDLTERFIRELSAVIQKQVFVPEFRPVASRYSRMLKGKADVSFLGFKLSLEPTSETMDELLEDIDVVLRHIGRRVIIVIDDLDRLEAKAVNNVLFTVRRTFKLSQATYILCYDTENLIGIHDEREKAREFLEKFVTVKLSLFVDSSTIKKFLERDWKSEEQKLLSVPSDSMLKLASILGELAGILGSDKAAKYMSIIGDLRKVKRFVNAMLLMQLERIDLEWTDFNRSDLINLILLHLNYPGLFRKIYVEETEGRSGMFCVTRGDGVFINSVVFTKFLEEQSGAANFLLEQLFDVKKLELGVPQNVDEAEWRSRACFNQNQNRNLEKYLKLIVRFATPEPRETFILYQDAVRRVRSGALIESVLEESDFRLENNGEHAHDQFWRLLVNQSYDFTQSVAEDAINTLIEYLPRYSSVEDLDRGLRIRAIYSLVLFLDHAGWGRTTGRRLPNIAENIVEIAQRIFGEGSYKNRGLIARLASEDRGVLGWKDLMLFRLTCSADRMGQLHNLYSALIIHEDSTAPTSGLVSALALSGMRRLSQEVFSLFQKVFIEPGRNFLTEVDETPDAAFLGRSEAFFAAKQTSWEANGLRSLADRVAVTRSELKGFVLYQLGNRQESNNAGIGCGFYDEHGNNDSGDIGKRINEYVFNVCFNPDVREENIYHFVDHCLSHLNRNFFPGDGEDGYVPTKNGLLGGLDLHEMVKYWRSHGEFILTQNLTSIERQVFTSNYTAFYREDLPKVFSVLDELSKDFSGSTR